RLRPLSVPPYGGGRRGLDSVTIAVSGPSRETYAMRATEKGFTLIELLIVVAIIGIIAAIAIPNLLNAIDRGKQKRTMADMRSIGTAVESYAVDNNFYPKGLANAAAAAISAHVSPIYIKTVPTTDGW